MGIITESLASKTEGLGGVELVRTKAEQGGSEASQSNQMKSIQKRPPIITSGNWSLLLSDRCLIYRNVVSRQRVVSIIPLRSIESFAVQTFKPKWPRLLALFIFLTPILIGLAAFLILGKNGIGMLSNFWAVDQRLVWISSVPMFLGVAVLVAYAFHSQTELVIYNPSGNNQVRLTLPGKLKGAVEQFVEAIESQMGEI